MRKSSSFLLRRFSRWPHAARWAKRPTSASTYCPGQTASVGNGSVTVLPPRPWNRQRRSSLRHPALGRGLDPERPLSGRPDLRDRPAQRRISRPSAQERRAPGPKFRSDMTAPEVAAMLETAFRSAAAQSSSTRLACSPGSSSAIRASSSTSSISIVTSCGARAGRLAPSSTAGST